MKNILAPSILSADFKVLGEQLKQIEAGGAEYIHFDVMDGDFVPSISFGMPVLSSIKGCTNQVMDVHLMITEPIRYVKEFKEAGADYLTVHYEACKDLHKTLEEIHREWNEGGNLHQAEYPGSLSGTVSERGGDVSYHVCRAGIWRTVLHPRFTGKNQ